MRPALVIFVACLLGLPARSGEPADALRFAWPSQGTALVELTDERSVGGSLRSSEIAMRLHVRPDGRSDRLVLEFSDARVVSGDRVPVVRADPASLGVAVARVMARATPTMVVSRDGEFLEVRDLERTTLEVVEAAGFPGVPMGLDLFGVLLSDVAAQDWSAWVGTWRGPRLAAGEWTRTDEDRELGGIRTRVTLTRRGLESAASSGRTRLEAVAVYPSESVRQYTSGFLIDMAREAEEIGEDPVVNTRFLDRARYSPLTETLTVELETATMRPIVVERVRTFSAVAGRHEVEGTERRRHRFTWSIGPVGP